MRAQADSIERVRSIAGVVAGIGVLMLVGTFPFVYGDPGPGEEKRVPGWALVIGDVGLVAIVLAMSCGFVLWLLSKRSARSE
jgi:hypothetical protein